ncbi:MAG: VOC family protein [Fimbriimonadaceae bacterium]|nr:VOC family protein [Fimbriimonadaceae bacterium]
MLTAADHRKLKGFKGLRPAFARMAVVLSFLAACLQWILCREPVYHSPMYTQRMNSTQPPSLTMHNTGIVVQSLDTAIAFFTELGMELEGRAMIEGEWAGRVTGLGDQQVEIAMMVTPDGHSRLELSQFLRPEVVADHRTAPVNAWGYLRVMFGVSDLNATLERLAKHGAEVVGEVVQYEDIYRLCYIRGPEGILIGLAEELNPI